MAGMIFTPTTNTINIVNGTASLDVAAASAVDVNANLTVNNATTLTGSPYTPGGTDVVVADGGTGASTLTDHGILLGSGTDPITPLGAATNGQLPVGSTGADPVLATITPGNGIDITNAAGSITVDVDLKANGGLVIETTELAVDLGASAITGTLAVGDGGTGAATFALNGVLYGNAASAIGVTAIGAEGQILRVGATPFIPAWTTATYPATTTVNQLLYSSSANVIAGLATGNSGVLITSGAGVPSIATDIPTAVTIGSAYIYRVGGTDVAVADGGTNKSSWTQYSIPYASTTTVLAEIAPAANSILVTDGSNIPSLATDIPTAVTIGAAYIYRAAGTDIPVTDGGTGVSTLTTAYGLLAAGTTATGTVQTLAAGTSGYLLQSGGAAALPSWTNTPALGTPSSGNLVNCTTDTSADNDSSTQIASTAFAKSQDAVLMREPDQGVAMTAAASGSSGITVADDDDIDFGTGNFALVWKGSLPDWSPSSVQTIFLKFQDADNYVQLYIETTGVVKLFVIVGGLTKVADVAVTGAVTNVDNSSHEIVVVVTRETASVAGSYDGYVNGVLSLTTAVTAGAPTSFSNTGSFYINGTSTVRAAGTIHHAYTLNFASTAAEVLDMNRNGIPESWKWGSQTELMSNQVDRDFSGASAWANVDLNAYDETGDLTITATAANQYCTCPVASAPTTIGKKYRMEFDIANIVSTWTIKSFDGTQTIGTVTANGTDTRIEWTATTTGGYRIVSDSTTSSGDFDNFSLVQIGATLAFLPENIQQDKWYDASTNGLNASYPTVGWTLTRSPSRRVKQPTPTAKTTVVTLTIAELLTGIITGTHAAGATQAYTLPTGTLCDAWPAFGIDDHFDWVLINLSAAAADTITVTAGADHTLVGEGIVQSAHASTGQLYGNSAKFRTRKTAANTFITYRVG